MEQKQGNPPPPQRVKTITATNNNNNNSNQSLPRNQKIPIKKKNSDCIKVPPPPLCHHLYPPSPSSPHTHFYSILTHSPTISQSNIHTKEELDKEKNKIHFFHCPNPFGTIFSLLVFKKINRLAPKQGQPKLGIAQICNRLQNRCHK